LADAARARGATPIPCSTPQETPLVSQAGDVYFSADVETDGPIPGPFSMLALAVVKAGTFDGVRFAAADISSEVFHAELRPISETFEREALAVNGMDAIGSCVKDATLRTR
jgi:hypothetical protein